MLQSAALLTVPCAVWVLVTHHEHSPHSPGQLLFVHLPEIQEIPSYYLLPLILITIHDIGSCLIFSIDGTTHCQHETFHAYYFQCVFDIGVRNEFATDFGIRDTV